MDSEKLLRQYVDTGIIISEHQFNRLNKSLRKTYLRKRFIAIYEYDSPMESFEFDAFGPEEIEKLKSRPRFIEYFHGLDAESILSNFYDTFDKDSSVEDIKVLIKRTPIGPKLDAVTDKIYEVFGKDVDFYNVVSEIMTKYDDSDLKMAVVDRYLDVINGELTTTNSVHMSLLRDTYRYYICKKLIDNYPSKNWLQRINNIIDRNMSQEDTLSIYNMILDKGYKIYGTTFAFIVRKISNDGKKFKLIEKYFKLPDVSSFDFTDLFTFDDGKLTPFYLNVLELFLKYHSKNLRNYDIERLLEKCPPNDIERAKSMINNASSSDDLYENINRIKELL